MIDENRELKKRLSRLEEEKAIAKKKFKVTTDLLTWTFSSHNQSKQKAQYPGDKMAKLMLKLYVVGHTALAKKAITNLTEICALPEMKDIYQFEVIDLLEHPQLAESEKIIATPMLIKLLPEPIRRIIGDLSDHKKVLVGLDINEI